MEYLVNSDEDDIYFKSQEFKDQIQASINKNTWDKNLPKYYINNYGDMVEHFKDGTINVIKRGLSLCSLRKNNKKLTNV